MESGVRLNEKSLYRILHLLLILGIILPDVMCRRGPWTWWISAAIIGTIVFLAVFETVSGKVRMLLAFAAAGSFLAAGMVWEFGMLMQYMVSFVRWFLQYSDGPEQWVIGYRLIQAVLLVLLGYGLEILIEKGFRLRLLSAAVLCLVLAGCLWKEQEVSRVSTACSSVYLMMTLAEWTQRHWNKVKKQSITTYMNWIMPFGAVYLVLLLWMPVPQKPYDWQAFKDMYTLISETLEKTTVNLFRFGREDFDGALSGFSEEGDLGGFLKTRRDEIMLVESDRGLKTNVYLTGKVYDSFDGRQWSQTAELPDYERYLDTARLMYAVQRYDKSYQYDFMQKAELQITYRYFHSRYLFAPLKLWSAEQPPKLLEFEEDDGSLMFGKKAGYGTKYKVSYYQMNLGQEAFDEFLEMSFEPDESLLKTILAGLKDRTGQVLTEDHLKEQEQAVYDVYAGMPELSDQVCEYLEQITEGAETAVEKLRAIEAAVSQLVYTLDPGQLPDFVKDEKSFLDYVLLENRQGYCSYFATVFVLLARAEGIPARFVQGYCAPLSSGQKVMVTSDMAHAWPEAYIDGIGWVPFEPTAGYEVLRYTPWGSRKSLAGIGSEPMDEDEIIEDMVDLSGRAVEEKESDHDTEAEEQIRVRKMAVLAMGIVLLSGGLMIMIERCLRRYRYEKMNVQQKYRTEIRRNFQILSWLHAGRQEEETLEEWADRLDDVLQLERPLTFIRDYEACVYGNCLADENLLKQTKEEQLYLMELFRKTNKWHYLYRCIF